MIFPPQDAASRPQDIEASAGLLLEFIKKEAVIPAYRDYDLYFAIKNDLESPIKVKSISAEKGGFGQFDAAMPLAELPAKGEKVFSITVPGSLLFPGKTAVDISAQTDSGQTISGRIELETAVRIGFEQYNSSECFIADEYYPDDFEKCDQFLAYLLKSGYSVPVIKTKLTPEILDSLNVLVISYIIQPLMTDERIALSRFLDSGGGLLLVGSFEDTNSILNDLADQLGLSIGFNFDEYTPEKWTKDIETESEITRGVESITYAGSTLEIKPPAFPLARQEGKILYAAQELQSGRVAAIGGYYMLRNDFQYCNQCRQLNVNLLNWLAHSPSI